MTSICIFWGPGVDDEILTEIRKFPFPVQQMIIKEYCAVDGRLEKGKTALGLTFLNCYYAKLLTPDTWNQFQ
ncbi:hypothetical protein RhiirC2_801399 [Rhizophagus irregularis]|uniref:Uncharacterized protein n=1 Tax=Rhizophagus irregularis TaxID=588596 RepID=A0A2N1M2F1_9GLOM|nr:hypothetical protein RhiirC2_801399 [Rhizophagus irregularis]